MFGLIRLAVLFSLFLSILLPQPTLAQCVGGAPDGTVESTEDCDDNNTATGDGCDATCNIEADYSCGRTVDFRKLTNYDYPGSSAAWVVAGDGLSGTQTVNTTNPTIALFGEDAQRGTYALSMGVELLGGDDDWWGIALGFNPGDETSNSADWLLIDWKMQYTAGMRLSHVLGAGNDGYHTFHSIGVRSCAVPGVAPCVTELESAANLGNTGWVHGQMYDVHVSYRSDRLIVLVDGKVEFDVTPADFPSEFPGGSFPSGEIGLYTLSQANVAFTNLPPFGPSICNITQVNDSSAEVYTGTASVTKDMAANFVDADDSISRLSITGQPTGATAAKGSTETEIVVTPTNPNIGGTYVVTYQICDDNSIIPDCDEATLTVTYIPDTDGDGIYDDTDIDDDNDGIPDSVEGDGTVDTDSDGTADSLDLDSDDDGVFDSVEAGHDGVDANSDGRVDGSVGTNGLADSLETSADSGTTDYDSDASGPDTPADTDSTAPGDWRDTDSDDDGVCDGSDAVASVCVAGPDEQRTDALRCRDSDSDGCDDCSSGTVDTANDGTDTDSDGQCNTGDDDDDGDGVCDGASAVVGVCAAGPDTAPLNATSCLDSDSDGCDDCSSGTVDTANDGTDTDSDGQCNTGDDDDDGDGICDGASAVVGVCAAGPDTAPLNATSCLDSDSDGCDDCLGGSYNPAADGTDTDSDGQCNTGDSDDDNDGVCDGESAVPDVCEAGPDDSPLDNSSCQDADGDGCDDCTSGTSDTANDGPDADADGICNAGEDGDGDGVIDNVDIDDDNDGSPDASENDLGLDPDGDNDSDGIANFVDADDRGDGSANDCESTVQSGVCDAAGADFDQDGDGVPNHLDLDADNDGLPDVSEAGLGIADSSGSATVDCAGGVGANGLCDELETFDDSGVADYNDDSSGPDQPRDTDEDGIADHLDLDSDNDGIGDLLEGGAGCVDESPADNRCDGLDTDKDGLVDELDDLTGFGDDSYDAATDTNDDGVPDYRSLDADGDQLSDLIEGGSGCVESETKAGICGGTDADADGLADDASATAPNSDASGAPDYQDLDSDGDGMSDAIEGTGDADGDGVPNYLDLDSDNDGVSDLIEGGSDCQDTTPRNGQCDGPDADGDGLADDAANTTPPDTDGDGTRDALDLDSDNDGIFDIIEGGSGCADESVEDGVCDGPDEDGDGMAEDATMGDLPDADGDGVPNYLDLDSDNDGLLDVVEGGSGCTDVDGNGLCDAPDTDGDGVVDSIDDSAGHGDSTMVATPNRDSDNDPDYVDLNSDNDDDGTPDVASTPCADLHPVDGRCDGPDTDGDGIVDAIDGVGDFGIFKDTDGDGVADWIDADDDNDGIPDTDEDDGDTDGDGVDDRLDLDSDNDGIPDVVEAGHDGTDADNDGTVDCAGGFGENGMCDALESSADSGNANQATVDTDGDGVSDFRDLDSDNDGLSDLSEGASSCTDAWTDGVCDGTDADKDGVVDSADGTDGFGTGGYTTPPDTDNDGERDYRDLDSDNDGIYDVIESGQGTTDLNNDGRVDGVDSDGDGILDAVDDSDGDGIVDAEDSDLAAFGGVAGGIDSDNDGTPDQRDTDSDGDGISDAEEVGDDPSNPVDTDGDGTPDFQDIDADGDGVNDDSDNCRLNANADQADGDDDNKGTACDIDDNADGLDDDLGIQGGCNMGPVGGFSGGWLLLALVMIGVFLRRRLSIAKGVLLVGLLLLIGQPATAQVASNFSAERFRLSSDRNGLIGVEWAEVPSHFSVDIAAWAGYADDPVNLSRLDENGDRSRVASLISGRTGGGIVASFGLWHRLQIGLDVPLVLYQTTDNGNLTSPRVKLTRFGLGDIRLIPKLGLLAQERDGVGLAFIVGFTLPTGMSSFGGEDNAQFAPELALSRSFGGVRLAANVGYRLRKKTEVLNLVVDDELFTHFGAGYRFGESGGPPLEVAVTAALATSVKDFADKFNRNYSELIFGAAYDVAQRFQLFAAAGVGVASGVGTPDWRALGGVRFYCRKNKAKPAPKVVDSDGDGIKDAADTCPNKPEDADGFEDKDGCPDLDNDQDGIVDTKDRCANDAEDKDGFEDVDGCPDLDNDEDGIGDAEDQCIDDAEDKDGFEDKDGCPDLDNDRDGIADAQDKCPNQPETVNNFEDEDGCPDEGKGPVKIQHGKITVPPVFFAPSKDVILKKSAATLELVAKLLKDNVWIKRVRVEGHSDSRGSDVFNKQLSERRAASVMQFLVDAGVRSDRLVSEGFGESAPIADNKTASGRAKNRRVVFVILDPPQQDEGDKFQPLQ